MANSLYFMIEIRTLDEELVEFVSINVWKVLKHLSRECMNRCEYCQREIKVCQSSEIEFCYPPFGAGYSQLFCLSASRYNERQLRLNCEWLQSVMLKAAQNRAQIPQIPMGLVGKEVEFIDWRLMVKLKYSKILDIWRDKYERK